MNSDHESSVTTHNNKDESGSLEEDLVSLATTTMTYYVTINQDDIDFIESGRRLFPDPDCDKRLQHEITKIPLEHSFRVNGSPEDIMDPSSPYISDSDSETDYGSDNESTITTIDESDHRPPTTWSSPAGGDIETDDVSFYARPA